MPKYVPGNIVPPEWLLIVPGNPILVEKIDKNNFWVELRVVTDIDKLLRFYVDTEMPTPSMDTALALSEITMAEITHARDIVKEIMAQEKK
jgi:hypothetical protein